MGEGNDLKAIEAVLSIGIIAIAGEHLFSTFLSSPGTTQKFSESEEDKRIIWKLYTEAAACTMIMAAIVAYLLKSWIPIATGAVVIVGYGFVYNEAVEHRL